MRLRCIAVSIANKCIKHTHIFVPNPTDCKTLIAKRMKMRFLRMAFTWHYFQRLNFFDWHKFLVFLSFCFGLSHHWVGIRALICIELMSQTVKLSHSFEFYDLTWNFMHSHSFWSYTTEIMALNCSTMRSAVWFYLDILLSWTETMEFRCELRIFND